MACAGPFVEGAGIEADPIGYQNLGMPNGLQALLEQLQPQRVILMVKIRGKSAPAQALLFDQDRRAADHVFGQHGFKIRYGRDDKISAFLLSLLIRHGVGAIDDIGALSVR